MLLGRREEDRQKMGAKKVLFHPLVWRSVGYDRAECCEKEPRIFQVDSARRSFGRTGLHRNPLASDAHSLSPAWPGAELCSAVAHQQDRDGDHSAAWNPEVRARICRQPEGLAGKAVADPGSAECAAASVASRHGNSPARAASGSGHRQGQRKMGIAIRIGTRAAVQSGRQPAPRSGKSFAKPGPDLPHPARAGTGRAALRKNPPRCRSQSKEPLGVLLLQRHYIAQLAADPIACAGPGLHYRA